MQAEFELSLLGAWGLRSAGGVLHLHLREQRVLALLAVRGPQSRGVLAGLLWPDHPEERARASLRTSVRNIRQQLGGAVSAGRDHVGLSERVSVDVDAFRATLDRIEREPPASGSGRVSALHVLRAPELLSGWYDEWVAAEREHLRHRRVRALVTLARLSLEDGAPAESIGFAEQAAQLEPLLESAATLHIRALLLDGSLTAALAEYEAFRERLRAELGIAPPRALTELVREARAQRSTRGAGRMSPAAPSASGGTRRHA
jgi:DNA-binding SARP family transcriptional activator